MINQQAYEAYYFIQPLNLPFEGLSPVFLLLGISGDFSLRLPSFGAQILTRLLKLL
jgi:hypothetical protein